MPLLRKDIRYVSDFTQFMNSYLEQHPDVAKGQIEGRALLWDKQVDREFQSKAQDSRVPQKAYVYQGE